MLVSQLRCPVGYSGTPVCSLHHHWRPRNLSRSWYSRPSACNDRKPRRSALWYHARSGCLGHNSTFRRPNKAFPPRLGRLAPRTNQSYEGSRHMARSSSGPIDGSSADTRPKSVRWRLGCRSIRAAELQRQRARCYARPGCCWPNPHLYLQYW